MEVKVTIQGLASYDDLLQVARETYLHACKLGPKGAEYCFACEDRRVDPDHAPDCDWEARKKRWKAVLAKYEEKGKEE